MRRSFLLLYLLSVSVLGFSQQGIPGKIIGKIPDSSSDKSYQIQVGAFKVAQNAENVVLRLQREGLSAATEKYLDFTRVMISGIPANQIQNYLIKARQMGFNEVIIREEADKLSISEKWEIDSPESAYTSFEFNRDMNYIAVENNWAASVRFGEYTMPARDLINLINLGFIRIKENNDNNVNFTFSSADEPDIQTSYTAAKAEAMPESTEIDLFCRTWRVVDCTEKDRIGNILFISKAGTYFFTSAEGELQNLSKWGWYDDKKEEFNYSHDNFESYGRAEILKLSKDFLELFDPGFNSYIPGYSRGTLENYWEFVPIDYEFENF